MQNSCRMNHLNAITNRIYSLETLKRTVKQWRLKDQRIVFTNGCFDILHLGHVEYLAKAADLGHKLVIGLNTDASVKRLGKGSDRPINHEDARAAVLAALHFVDAIVFFDDDTPLELIKALQPDALVKGGDYDAGETNPNAATYIVGSDIVKAQGGEVAVIPLTEGFSTTNTIAKIKSEDGKG